LTAALITYGDHRAEYPDHFHLSISLFFVKEKHGEFVLSRMELLPTEESNPHVSHPIAKLRYLSLPNSMIISFAAFYPPSIQIVRFTVLIRITTGITHSSKMMIERLRRFDVSLFSNAFFVEPRLASFSVFFFKY